VSLLSERVLRPSATDPAVLGRVGRTRTTGRARAVVVSVALVLGCLVTFAVSLSVGDFAIPLRDVVSVLVGRGTPDADFIVGTLRLPRAVTAVGVGVAFGLSGAIFQNLARNPLASPDIIGVTAGASTAAVLVVVVGSALGFSTGALPLPVAAFVCGLISTTAVYLLAYRNGLSAYRLVLVGIGIAAMLTSTTSFLLARAEISDVQRALVWLTGSLNGRGWDQVVPLAVSLAVLVPVVLLLARPLRALQLGDDTARGLGVPVARTVFSPTELPVGIVTGLVGAPLPVVAARPGQPRRKDRLMTVMETGTTSSGTLGERGRQPVDTRLRAEDLCLGYDGTEVVRSLSVSIPTGKITCVVGANACGKSTLLRGLARLLQPTGGRMVLDGADIRRLKTREVACRLGILPQSPTAPDGITVADLVARGRYPHQSWLRQWGAEDEVAVAAALVATDTLDLAERSVDELSGGQRQRVWIAMTLAQGTDLMLLDEPTTSLDLAHQVEVLDLLADLNVDVRRTVVLVLHDLDQAARYSDHLIALKDGEVVVEGPPAEVVIEALVREVFGLDCRVVPDPVTGTPTVIPFGRRGRRAAARGAA